ncbi:MAG: succinyl-diaminopimelate desuccinylase [Holosporales bacterium]|jgi:succinyl-diaminopimelate desuccinylase|nr:succinyl-diaminopimelate desuccinylase [Holosporales bacterium]
MKISPLSSLSPLELTCALVAFKSVTPRDEGCLSFLEDILQGVGFATVMHPSKTPDGPKNLTAVYGEGARTLVFLGHTDVVPEGREPWDGFTPQERGGILFGRGVADMKGGIASFVVAAARFIAQHPTFPGKLVVLLTGDEEVGSPEGIQAILPWAAQNYGPFTACLVGEPSSCETLGDHIALGHRGSLNLFVTAQGVQGHVANPERARNPIPILMQYLQRITTHVWESDPGDFAASNLEVTSIDVDNPVSNIIPSQAHACANIRFHIQHNSESIANTLQALAAETSECLSVETVPNGEAFLCQDEELIGITEEAVRETLHITPRRGTEGGTTDGRFVASYCPVMELGMISRTIHHKGESIPSEDCERLAQVYETFLQKFFLRI